MLLYKNEQKTDIEWQIKSDRSKVFISNSFWNTYWERRKTKNNPLIFIKFDHRWIWVPLFFRKFYHFSIFSIDTYILFIFSLVVHIFSQRNFTYFCIPPVKTDIKTFCSLHSKRGGYRFLKTGGRQKVIIRAIQHLCLLHNQHLEPIVLYLCPWKKEKLLLWYATNILLFSMKV